MLLLCSYLSMHTPVLPLPFTNLQPAVHMLIPATGVLSRQVTQLPLLALSLFDALLQQFPPLFLL